MNPYKETFDTWNKVAALCQDKFMDLDLYNDTYDVLCGLLDTQKARLLEAGCGQATLPGTCLPNGPI